MCLTVLLLQGFTQHENELLLILSVGQELVLLHCHGHVSCECHSSASISFGPSLVCHVLCVSVFIPIKDDYGISVLPGHPKHTGCHCLGYLLGYWVCKDSKWHQRGLVCLLLEAKERNQKGLVGSCKVHT